MWTWGNHNSPNERDEGGGVKVWEGDMMIASEAEIMCFEHAERGPHAKESGQPIKRRRTCMQYPFRDPTMDQTWHLGFSSAKLVLDVWPPELWKNYLCYFKSLNVPSALGNWYRYLGILLSAFPMISFEWVSRSGIPVSLQPPYDIPSHGLANTWATWLLRSVCLELNHFV